jgi:hypothetical protein
MQMQERAARMASSEGWIPCRVYDGMFSDERAVEVDVGSRVMTLYVSRDVVKGDAEAGRLKVQVVERDGEKWAVLPTSTREAIPVSEGQLSGA